MHLTLLSGAREMYVARKRLKKFRNSYYPSLNNTFRASDKFLLTSSVKILTCSSLSVLVDVMMHRIC